MQEGSRINPDAHRVKQERFRTVYEEYKKSLGTFLYHLLAQKDEMEDLYQEVFKKFWVYLQNSQELPNPEQTKKWLYTVARHLVIDKYRKEGKLSSDPLENVEQTLYEPVLTEERLLDWERLQWVLTKMTPKYRICLVLQELYGYSQKEIAALLKITKQTVSTNVSRGRKQLIVLDNLRRKKEEGDDLC